MALSLKGKLFDYFAQRHFDLMKPELRARFDDYAKNEDFLSASNMKTWNDKWVHGVLPDLANGGVGTVANDHQLTDDEWGDLYDAFQEAFQRMDIAKIPSIGYSGEYKKATKDFIEKWFGAPASGKIFIPTQATTTADNILSNATNNLADFLHIHRGFKDVFKRNLKDVFSDIDYDGFIQKLRTKEYNSNIKFREKVIAVVGYINDYGPRQNEPVPSGANWPSGVGYTATSGYVTSVTQPILNDIYTNADTDKWFEIPTATRNAKINDFKQHYTEIFDTLLSKSKVREHFLAQTNRSIITEPLTEAIKQTDYENKESKDYLPPKYPDEKNWVQELEKWEEDTYENYFRKFTNPSRGTRIYFSPWSQEVIKAFDKLKIKPTDGLEGIISKKDDILKKLVTSATATDHFKWFTSTIEKLKDAGMSKAIEGALRNGAQLRHVASAIIAEAVENGKVTEAKTALEILSVAKYGLTSSRRYNALKEATKDMKIFSDDKLSWNKNEGIQFVTKGIDATAGFALKAAGLAVTGVHNFIQHRRTKIGNDIRKNDILKKAHDHWDERDTLKKMDKEKQELADALSKLGAGKGKSGKVIDATTIAAEKANLLTLTPDTEEYKNLKADIDNYETSVKRQDAINIAEPTERQRIQDLQRDHADHPEKDPYRELIAYWNMLESVGKTHSFTLGSMDVKRKAFLKGYKDKTSNAQNVAAEYLKHFGNLRAA